ncbi:MAG TPA: hypothetical protein VGP99_06300, partial [Tepidisphaeraceae bacterium]|nr:hypothetical protein [Tepidisphaeraceae bacterium]
MRRVINGDGLATFWALDGRRADVIATVGAEVGAPAAMLLEKAPKQQNRWNGKQNRGECGGEGDDFFARVRKRG